MGILRKNNWQCEIFKGGRAKTRHSGKMIVGILGNSNLKKAAAIANKTEEEIADFYRDIGRKLAEMNAEIAMVPEGALLELAMGYKENGGGKIIGVVPRQDKIWGVKHLEEGIAAIDEEYDCGDWFRQPYELIKVSDALLIASLGTGVFGELTMLKYCYKFSKIERKTIVFTNYLREGKLPAEIEYDIKPLVRYVSTVDEMEKELLKK